VSLPNASAQDTIRLTDARSRAGYKLMYIIYGCGAGPALSYLGSQLATAVPNTCKNARTTCGCAYRACARSAPLAGGRAREARPRQPCCARSAPHAQWPAHAHGSEQCTSSKRQGIKQKAKRSSNFRTFSGGRASRAALRAPTPSRVGKHICPHRYCRLEQCVRDAARGARRTSTSSLSAGLLIQFCT
jgi:hypothetical protein